MKNVLILSYKDIPKRKMLKPRPTRRDRVRTALRKHKNGLSTLNLLKVAKLKNNGSSFLLLNLMASENEVVKTPCPCGCTMKIYKLLELKKTLGRK